MPQSPAEISIWIDSLLRAYLSRGFAAAMSKEIAEQAFTASLISDVALPVLLSVWAEYYTPIITDWRRSPRRLSELERERFGWDHSQASAWIVQSWGFPDELVCYLGTHNLSMDDIQKWELEDTIAVPMSIASQSVSVLKQDTERNRAMYASALAALDISSMEFADLITAVKTSFNDNLSLFGLSNRGTDHALDQLVSFSQTVDQENCP
jgi:HD-like signal output (HDOD) protein